MHRVPLAIAELRNMQYDAASQSIAAILSRQALYCIL